MWAFPSNLNRPYMHVKPALSQELVTRVREEGASLPMQVAKVRQGSQGSKPGQQARAASQCRGRIFVGPVSGFSVRRCIGGSTTRY